MRKVISVLLIAAMVMCMTACGAPAGEKEPGVIYLDDPTDENVKRIEPVKKTDQDDPDIAPADEEGVIDEEGEPIDDPDGQKSAKSARVKIFLPDDSGKKFITYSTDVEKLDAGHIVSAMKAIGILGSDVNAVSLSSVDDGGKTLLNLDMNVAFGKQVSACGTSEAYMLMGCVVNTFLDAFDGSRIVVTSGNMEISGYAGALTAFGDNPNPPDNVEETEETEETEEAEETSDKPKDDNAVVATALAHEGAAFENNAAGPNTFDNSGFVYFCFKENGISIPRRTADMFGAGTAVEKDSLEKGDVVFYDLDGNGKPTYVAIYIGNGKAITESATSNAAKQISLSTNYYADRYFGARRYK